MADATKPDLKATHDRLEALARYLLETAARLQVVSAPSAVMDLQSLTDQAKVVMQSVMDLEAYLA